MSEHIVALALAAAKRLFIEQANLKSGEFNQGSANRILRGGVCGILGFGNVGVATARLMHAFGMKIHAINRRGASHEPTDWIGTTDLLDEMLRRVVGGAGAAWPLRDGSPVSRPSERDRLAAQFGGGRGMA